MHGGQSRKLASLTAGQKIDPARPSRFKQALDLLHVGHVAESYPDVLVVADGYGHAATLHGNAKIFDAEDSPRFKHQFSFLPRKARVVGSGIMRHRVSDVSGAVQAQANDAPLLAKGLKELPPPVEKVGQCGLSPAAHRLDSV